LWKLGENKTKQKTQSNESKKGTARKVGGEVRRRRRGNEDNAGISYACMGIAQ
jgi:hypothetical protein